MKFIFSQATRINEVCTMTEKENNIWVWESLTVALTNPEGETITLNSLCFNDNTLTYLGNDLEEFVKNEGGVLE